MSRPPKNEPKDTPEFRQEFLGLLKKGLPFYKAVEKCSVDITLDGIYKIRQKDTDFDQECRDILSAYQEKMLDVAEMGLLHNIAKFKERSIIFALTTRGQARGYVRKEMKIEGDTEDSD